MPIVEIYVKAEIGPRFIGLSEAKHSTTPRTFHLTTNTACGHLNSGCPIWANYNDDTYYQAGAYFIFLIHST